MNVEVHSVDACCDLCGATLNGVPVAVAQQWLAAHHDPALTAVELTLDGERSIWRRR